MTIILTPYAFIDQLICQNDTERIENLYELNNLDIC